MRIEQSNSLFEGEDQLEVKVTPSLPPEFTIIASKSSIGSISVLVSSIHSNSTNNIQGLIEFKELMEENGKNYFVISWMSTKLLFINVEDGFIEFTHWTVILQILIANGAIWANHFLN